MRYRLAHSRDIKRNRWNNVCPSCGQRKFSPYIDTVTGKPIDEKNCGRCCRERSCAYHMTPSEWFKDNPTEKREWLPKEQYIELMRQRRREARVASPPALSQGEGASSAMPVSPLLGRGKGEAASYLSRMSTLCHKSRSDRNNLARWLSTRFPAEQVAEVLARYRTGSTRDGRIIYWQIDEHGQVRAGKVMAYDLATGHRVKKEEASPLPLPRRGDSDTAMPAKPLHRGRDWGGSPPICWVHSMRIDGIKFDEMLVPQCLFGLSLLNTEHTVLTTDYTDFSDSLQDGRSTPHEGNPCNPRNPLSLTTDCTDYKPDGRSTPQGKNPCNPRNLWSNNPWSEKIRVVESEKTALIMSLVCPDQVWLATGGKANFKEQMLAPLIGLEVAVYPDADALHDWYARAVEMNRRLGTRLYIPTWYYNMMDHPEAIARGLDLADMLLDNQSSSPLRKFTLYPRLNENRPQSSDS